MHSPSFSPYMYDTLFLLKLLKLMSKAETKPKTPNQFLCLASQHFRQLSEAGALGLAASANLWPSVHKAMGILPLPLVERNFYIICLYTYSFLAVYTPRHLLLFFDKVIFVVCPLTHIHICIPSLYLSLLSPVILPSTPLLPPVIVLSSHISLFLKVVKVQHFGCTLSLTFSMLISCTSPNLDHPLLLLPWVTLLHWWRPCQIWALMNTPLWQVFWSKGMAGKGLWW